MKNNILKTASGFSALGVAPGLLETLTRLRFTAPTPIQQQVIPVAIQGKDIVGIAQTGTGKTLAFGIPLIQRLTQVKGQALVILPTRELALQVEEVLRRVGGNLGFKTVVLIGGAAVGPQIGTLKRNPSIIVGTPGRLIDHLNQKTLRLDGARIVVLDEADRMFDMGFAPQIGKILRALPRDRQTMLFSATMPPAIMKLAAAHMKLPIRIEVAPSGTLPARVTQEIFIIHKAAKNRLLEKLLERYPGTTLIFVRTKYTASRLVRAIRAMGHSAAEIHGSRSLGQRREALEGFKAGKYRILVATDIASRGIQVVGIGLVLNYDLPTNPEDYVHRIGRTARAGAGGHAVSFISPEQRGELRRIERLIRKTLPISQLPELPPDREPPRKDFSPSRPREFQRGPRESRRPSFNSLNRRSPRFPRRPA